MTERKTSAKAEEKLGQRLKRSNGDLQAAGLEECEFGVQE
jgi:hypothetical protein